MVSKRGASGAVPSATAAAIATDPLSYLIDFREHDVPYGVRASIDLDLRVGAWYKVSVRICSHVQIHNPLKSLYSHTFPLYICIYR